MLKSKSKLRLILFGLTVIIVAMLTALWLVKLGIKISIISGAIQPQTPATLPIGNIEQYKIFSKIIEKYISRNPVELILIENETSYELLHEDSEKEKPPHSEINNELWMEFLQKNQDHHILSTFFALSKPYILIDSNNRERINRDLLFTNNIEHTPFLQFSEVGLSPQNDEALVHVSLFSWGDSFFKRGTFGFGEYFYLKKVDGVWKILNEWQSFIT